MLQRDYIMRMVQLAVQAIMDAVLKRAKEDPQVTCDKLEDMLGQVADMDGGVLLSLDPDSIGTMLELGGVMTDSSAELWCAPSSSSPTSCAKKAGTRLWPDLRFAQAQGIASLLPGFPNSMREVVTKAGQRARGDRLHRRKRASYRRACYARRCRRS